MPTVDESGLRKLLAAGEPGRLYVVAGEEKVLVRRLAAQVIKKAAGEAFPEFNRQAFTNDSSLDAVGDAAQALPFFAQHKCVAVADYDVEAKAAQELERLYELWDLTPESTTLVFWYPTLEADPKGSAKWRKFFQLAEEKGVVALCPRRSQGELVRYLVRQAEKAGCALSRENAAKVVEYAGQDLTALRNEMEKLCAYALGAGGGEITGEMVERLVAKSTETTVFLMANALVAGDYARAYTLLDALFYQREEPVAIVAALAASYLDMVRVRAAVESGYPYEEAARYGSYKKNQMFRLRNAQRNGRRVSLGVLRKSLHLLLEADLALKGSRLDSRVVLDQLVARLLLAAQEDLP